MKALIASFVLLVVSSPVLHAAEVAAEVTAADQADSRVWPHDGSDLRPNSKAVFGKLDNGLRYVILPHKQAAARASLRMFVRVGSLMETDDQRGIAHFLEHMAFNGSRQFPSGETIEYLQRLGMSFSADTNASTSFDRTIYQLELPRANEELTGTGLKLFRDFLDGMTLDEKQIDKERGIILAELLARNTANFRAASPALQFALPESIVSRRLPLGEAAQIRKFSRDQFVEFYETWYTPGRTVIVAVGDFDKQMVERLIREHFTDAKARRGERPDPAIGKISPLKELAADVHRESDLDSVTVEISTSKSAEPIHDSLARQRVELVQAMATIMLNTRLDRIARADHAPFQSASFGHQRMFNFVEFNNLSASCRAGQWTSAMSTLEQELRRALEHGFSETEFASAKAQFSAIVKMMADQAETRQPSELAGEIIDTLAKGEVFLSPVDVLPMMDQLFAGLTKDDCHAAFRETWANAPVRVWVQGNLPEGEADAGKVLTTYRASGFLPVVAPTDESQSGLAYTDFGPEGKVVAREVHEDLDLTTAVFANHLRLNVKHSDLEKNVVRVVVRFGNGLLELPADKPGLKLLATGTFISGGLKAHSLVELNRILADKPVTVTFNVGDDAFNLEGNCTPAMLDLQFQVCTAYLTAPAFREEARTQFLGAIDQVYAERERTLEGVLGPFGPVYSHLRSDDARFSLPPRDAMHALTADDLRSWLAAPLSEGYMEVTVVGDVDADQVIAAAAKTFGALPERAAVKPAKGDRNLKFPVDAKLKQFHFDSAAKRSAAMVSWPAPGARDVPLSRRVSVLAMILNERLRVKVREELGASYTPEVGSFTSDAFPDFGYVSALISVDPDRLAELGTLVVAIGDELAKGSISDDEFDRVMKPALASVENRDNRYWLNALKDCQEHTETLAIARGRQKDWSAITKSELEALARQVLAADRATIINISPKPKAGK